MLDIRLAETAQIGNSSTKEGFTILDIDSGISGRSDWRAIALSIGTSSKVLVLANTQEVAKDVAASDMEYIRSLPFADNYILLTSSSSSSSLGNSVIFKAIVTPGAATGTVAFKDGSTY